MYRLFIVDDERRTRNGLATLVDWEDLGFQVSGLFAYGGEALAAFAKEPADVVLTDIRMEGFSGTELAGKLCELYPQVQIVFISGHRDFEYARLAIRYHVQNYLLKPIKMDELRAAFTQIRNQLDARPQTGAPNDGRSFRYLRSEFFRFLLNGIADNETAETEADYFKLTFFRREYRIAVLELHKEIAYSFEEPMLDSYLSQLCTDAGVLRPPAGLFRLWGSRYVLPLEATAEAELRRGFHAVLVRSADMADIPLTVGISASHSGRRDAAVAYREACAAAAAGPEQVTVYSTEQNGDAVPFGAEDVDGMASYLCEGNEAAVRSMALLAADRLAGRGQGFSYVKNQMVQLLSEVLSALPRRLATREVDYMALLRAGTLEELVRVFCLNLAPALHLAREQKKEDRGGDFTPAFEYLQNNFTDPELSLEQLSSMIFVSPSYFSRLFKQETGEHFSEYLTRLRIEHAKALLDRGFSIGEASRRSGYSNTKYFSRLFKRQTGATASDYKAGRQG